MILMVPILIGCFYLTSTLLWFVIGALINPEAMLPYATMVITGVMTLSSTWKHLVDMREQVLQVIYDQLDFVVGNALDMLQDLLGIDLSELAASEGAQAK